MIFDLDGGIPRGVGNGTNGNATLGTPPPLGAGTRPNLPSLVAEDDKALGGWWGVPRAIVALSGGTGTRLAGTGVTDFDRRILKRMDIQDKAVLVMLLVMYSVTLAFGLSVTYRMSLNGSPVKYYADPRHHSFVCEDSDVESFLEAFNQSPKNVHLQVAGFMPSPEGPETVEWRGQHHQMAFSFSLDLSPWVVRAPGRPEAEGRDLQEEGRWDESGVQVGDAEVLHNFLIRVGTTNPLAKVQLHKQVDWPEWEDIATNVRHRIRQRGFAGIVSVRKTPSDEVIIFQNKPWANFMHNGTTKVLAVLSFIGGFVYLPYMWLRCSRTKVRSRFHVDVSIAEYWNLISERLCADGFEAQA